MTLLPTKYVPIDSSVLGVSSLLLNCMGANDSVSTLWDRVRSMPQVRTFDRYADALTLLFAARILDMEHGTLVLASDTGSRT